MSSNIAFECVDRAQDSSKVTIGRVSNWEFEMNFPPTSYTGLVPVNTVYFNNRLGMCHDHAADLVNSIVANDNGEYSYRGVDSYNISYTNHYSPQLFDDAMQVFLHDRFYRKMEPILLKDALIPVGRGSNGQLLLGIHSHYMSMVLQDYLARLFESGIDFHNLPDLVNLRIRSFLGYDVRTKANYFATLPYLKREYYILSYVYAECRFGASAMLEGMLCYEFKARSFISERYHELRTLRSHVKVLAQYFEHIPSPYCPRSVFTDHPLSKEPDNKLFKMLLDNADYQLSNDYVIAEMVADLFPLFYHLQNAETVVGYLVPIFSFLRLKYKSGMLNVFSYVVKRHANKYEPRGATPEEGSNDPVENFISLLEMIASNVSNLDTDSLKSSLIKILSCACAHSVLPNNMIKSINWLGLIDSHLVIRWEEGKGIPEVAADCLNAAASILRVVCGRPKKDHVFTITSSTELVSCIQWLIQYEYHRHPDGVVDPHCVSDGVWIKNLDEAWSKCEKIYIPMHERSSVTRLKKYLLDMRTKAMSIDYGHRPLPFNIGLRSGPGTGKSTWIVPAFAKAGLDGLGVRHNYTSETITGGIANVNGSDKYLSTYNAVKHPVVSFDEMGSGKAEMQRDNNLMNDIVSLLGENDYFPAKADVSEKGKVAYKPFINILSSNHQNFGVNDYINNQDAFWRRIHVMFEIRVKSEYQVQGAIGTQIDPLKVTNGCYDCVEFRPMLCTASGPVHLTEENPDADWIDFEQARDLVYRRALKHRMLQTGINRTRELITELDESRCVHGLLSCPKCNHSEDRIGAILDKMGIPSEVEPRSTQVCLLPLSFFENVVHILNMGLLVAFYGIALCYCYVFKKDKLNRIRNDLAAAYGLMARFDSVMDRVEYILAHADRGKREFLTIAAGMALVATMLTFYKIASSDKKEKKECVEKEAEETLPPSSTQPYGGIYGSPPPTNTEVSKNPYDQRDGFVIYGKKASMPEDVWQKRLSMNFLSVNIYKDDGTVAGACSLLGVCQQYAIGPWHTLRFMKRHGYYLNVRIATSSDFANKRFISVLFKMRSHPSLVTYLENDIALIKLSDCSAFHDLTECFPSDVNYSGSLLRLEGEIMKHNQHELKIKFEPFLGRKSRVSYDIGGEVMSPNVYDGLAATNNEPGCCGGILTAIRGPQKFIVGLLVAGVTMRPGIDPEQYKRHMFGILHKDILMKGIAHLNAGGVVISPFSALLLAENRFIDPSKLVPPDMRNHSSWVDPADRGVTDFIGSLDVGGRKEKSLVSWYPNGKQLLAELPESYRHNLVQPKFDATRIDGEYLSPEKHALTQIARPVTNINIGHLKLAIDHVVARFCKISDFQHDMILDPDTCVSGSDHNPFVKSMDLTTGTGFGYDGKKINYTEPIPEGHPQKEIAANGYKLKEDFKDKLYDMIETYRRGYRVGIIMEMLKKDEPRDAEKVRKRTIRLFVGVTICNYILTKMYFGMWMGIFVKNPILAETVGGINSHGAMWGKLYQHLSKFSKVINGDFSKYDKLVSILMLLAAFTVIKRVKQHFGKIISEDHNRVMDGIASDISNPILLLGRDLLFQPGSLASGVLLTFVLNNIVNSLYIRLAYLDIESSLYPTEFECMESFDDNCVFMAGGDDNTYTVSDDICDRFNFKTIQQYFASIGLKYTPADKSDRDYLYEPIENATIFKRKWVFDPEYNIWKAPLERQSIGKMLTICVKSKAVSMEVQQSQALNQAVSELAQYSREEFYEVVNILKIHFPDLNADYDAILREQSSSEVTPWLPEENIPFVEGATPLSCDGTSSAAQFEH